MKQYFLKAAGMAILALTLHATGFTQDEAPKEKKSKLGDHDEIVIKQKGDKDSKVTIEIKDGQVFINGKQVDEYDDDNISVHKRAHVFDGENFGLITPDVVTSPFRGDSWSFSSDGYGDGYNMKKASSTAFLGVNSEKAEDGGVRITEITKASAAEKSGLKEGDIITKIDETQISSQDELAKTIHKYKPEDKITVTYKRDGKEQKLTLVLGKYKMMNMQSYSYSMPKMEEFQGLGNMNAPRAMTIRVGRPRIGIKAQDTEDGKGVKVLDVDDESPADKAGIKEGDVITEFDGKAVNSAEELANLSRGAKDKFSFKVKFKRDDKPQEVEVKIPKKLKTADL